MKTLLLLAGILFSMGRSEASLLQEASKAAPGEATGAARAPSGLDPQNTPTDARAPTERTLENTDVAGESDAEDRRQLVRWNRYEGPYFTVKLGAGLLYEVDAFAQDRQSKEQFGLHPGYKVRDFRLLLNGRFPKFKRSVTWCLGLMYDGPTNSWYIRQTGLMIAVPELWGSFFIGRAKEGFSLNKVMTGYDGWTMERFPMNDATVPLLADGI